MRVFTTQTANYAAGPPVLEWKGADLRLWLTPPGPVDGGPRTNTLLVVPAGEVSDLANALLDALANRPQPEAA